MEDATSGAGNLLYRNQALPTPAQEIFLGKLADRLGISIDEFKAAVTGARVDTLDELVAQGRITEEQKEQRLERMQQREDEGRPCFGPGKWHGKCGHFERPKGRGPRWGNSSTE